MKKELESLLAEYLGELLYKKENTFDWIEKDKIIRKINAVNELLEIEDRQRTFSEAIEQLYASYFKKKT